MLFFLLKNDEVLFDDVFGNARDVMNKIDVVMMVRDRLDAMVIFQVAVDGLL